MQGKLLIAHPLLNDGFFNRSVVYISQYEQESVVGFVLNFKTQFKLRDVRPQVQNGNLPIFEGGPVAKNQLFFLHSLGEKIPNSFHVQDNLYFGGDFNELLYQIDHENISEGDVRFFVGYSGWDKDQLEDEITKGSWFVADADPGVILSLPTTSIWANELERQRKTYRIFGEIGSDPSMN
ncbi:MAG: YqgE/AlgH family protein [Bacteroidota bacterium]|nr:YqgE/AlgH family protein [Bacteroidota bacterium]